MSSATENNGEVAVEKPTADATALKDEKQATKSDSEEEFPADMGLTKDQLKTLKRAATTKTNSGKNAKKAKPSEEESEEDEEEIIEEEVIGELESDDVDSEDYDLPYEDSCTDEDEPDETLIYD